MRGRSLAWVIGWRVTFFVVAALGVVGLLGVAALVPEQPRPEGVRLRHELAAFRNIQVLLAMAMTVLGFGGVFATITYIAPMMTEIAGYSASSVTWLLVFFGPGMVGGNLLGDFFADRRPPTAVRRPMAMLYVFLGALAVILALFSLTAHDKFPAAVTIVLIGSVGFATVPPLQTRVFDQASAAPILASAVNIGAFNLGNALSAWLGGLVIAAGLGYTAPSWVGAALAASALVRALLSGAPEHRPAGRTARRPPQPRVRHGLRRPALGLTVRFPGPLRITPARMARPGRPGGRRRSGKPEKPTTRPEAATADRGGDGRGRTGLGWTGGVSPSPRSTGHSGGSSRPAGPGCHRSSPWSRRPLADRTP